MTPAEPGISFRELLAYTDYLANRWLKFFSEKPEALEVPAGGNTPTVADLVDHVFLVEEVFSSFLREGTPPPESAVGERARSVEAFARRHQDAHRKIAEFLSSADDTELRAKKKFSRFEASPRKLLTQSILHSVHHWAQIAMLVRRAGFDFGRPQDLILTDILE